MDINAGTRVIPDASKQAFAAHYPTVPAKLAHDLAGHPLLTLDALAAFASRMRPDTLEHNAALNTPLGTRLADLPSNGLSTVETIERIADCGSWVLLRAIEQDPAYDRLMADVLGEVAPIIEASTGPMLKLRGFIFISSPGALTQPHFDPEYNILFQARGTKTMTLYPVADEEVLGQPFIEQYYSGGQRYMPWRSEWEHQGNAVHLAPGDAVYVPLLAPHWVKVHDQPSVSLSLTWCSEWSLENAAAYKFNHRLRRIGLAPAAPRSFPRANRLKSLGERVWERVERRVA